MPDKTRIRSIGILTTSAFLVLVLSTFSQGQNRARLNAPTALLDVLDPDDRNCVVQNGGLRKAVNVQPIQLAAGSRQILVRGSGSCLCGAQNCGFWIYRKTPGKYELLLKGIGSTKVSAGRGLSKGHRNVVTESHASANETVIRTYRFDGAQYQLQRCVYRAFYDDNGNQTKRPRFRPCE